MIIPLQPDHGSNAGFYVGTFDTTKGEYYRVITKTTAFYKPGVEPAFAISKWILRRLAVWEYEYKKPITIKIHVMNYPPYDGMYKISLKKFLIESEEIRYQGKNTDEQRKISFNKMQKTNEQKRMEDYE